jgi:adhesin transport system membrane fusion protein
MSWFKQATTFFKEVRNAKKQKEEVVPVEELENVSSASEARLLHTPGGASFLILVTLLLIVSLLVWSVVAPIDEVAKAKGKVIPSKQVQTIQNLEGGILQELKVHEGQVVKQGAAPRCQGTGPG